MAATFRLLRMIALSKRRRGKEEAQFLPKIFTFFRGTVL
jgi:hypothetical protein